MYQYFIKYQIREDIFIEFSNKIKMGGSTADRHAIIITTNSFGIELSKDDCAKLNPDGLATLARADEKFKRERDSKSCNFKVLNMRIKG